MRLNIGQTMKRSSKGGRMIASSRPMRMLPLAAACFIAATTATVVTGCKDNAPVEMGDTNADNVPTMLTRNVETLVSDSGVMRYRVVTPIWYVYDEVDEPYWSFPEGLNLEKFDNFFRQDAKVVADSAVYFKNKQIWRLDGNVNITNVMGEKFVTNQLFWNQRQHKLYSDSFIHIERTDKVLEGYGFDSNEQLTRYSIRNVSGIFPAAAFQPGGRKAADNDADNNNDDETVDDNDAPQSVDTLKVRK